MSTKTRYKTDYYVPTKTPETRFKLWMKNMKTLATRNVKERLEELYLKKGGSSPFEVFVRTAKIDVEYLCDIEYLKLTRRHYYELEAVNGKIDSYNERLEKEEELNEQENEEEDEL